MIPNKPPELVETAKPVHVKNKQPAAIQVTAEQILREAKERQEALERRPKQRMIDGEELYEMRYLQRKAFEDKLKANRMAIGLWLKYARWEEDQRELVRARSVYDRCLQMDARSVTAWIKYTEMEMRFKNINHARNLYDRAVAVLPRVDQLWYKYAYMEEMLGNVNGARQVFERWMEWEPDENAWNAYIKFERRYEEIEKARKVFERFDRFVFVHAKPKNWIKYARFEEENRNFEGARNVFERAVEYYGDEFMDVKLIVEFAKFESRMKEIDRARVIFKYALEKVNKEKAESLYKKYSQFEKQFGNRIEIEKVTLDKRRLEYEELLKENEKNYDVWFDYARLEEANKDSVKIREIYERAISQIPPTAEKKHWRRYIFLWINYAIYEEIENKDFDKAKEIYQTCLKLIPHKQFTFAKVWILFSKFLIRRKDFISARKNLGLAIGICPKDKIFKAYIELELKMREFDRCRILYEKYIQWNPANSYAWIKYAELEKLLGDNDRSRSIFTLAISQKILDRPDVVWKSFIDFEIENEEFDNVRSLYERLLSETEHVKVWISFANFEKEISQFENARNIYERAYSSLKDQALDEQRLILLEAWKEFENFVDPNSEFSQSVQSKFPKKVKKRRKVVTDDGLDAGYEEYYHYIFPDDRKEMPHLKLLEMAHKWKKEKNVEKPKVEVEGVNNVEN
ncbi:hypothetical protein O9G_004459 [Rozella allomycis CSF55]|uniref:Pre-mRNA-splicing factor Syf1/CRNKL1-like C-terminal HAT-repeats domain-containing protein n=1 Tax=Rozella allomycis (strain CSF55) TaxID=988480 RepID=A0A075B387_ROZAC|nr:hypothetical protein O9G_004459 [Rozella allomycis CSF55]|eukprot:EPZ37048.1 hypothetical protein O9G_004459 [Rozella allomycis CSF55]